MMKTITLAVTAMLSLAVLTMTAMSQSQTSDAAYEKESYNYAELLGKPPYPPRTMFEVQRLFDDDIIEIDRVFYAPTAK